MSDSPFVAFLKTMREERERKALAGTDAEKLEAAVWMAKVFLDQWVGVAEMLFAGVDLSDAPDSIEDPDFVLDELESRLRRLEVAEGLLLKLDPDPGVIAGLIIGWELNGKYMPNGGVLTPAESALLSSLTEGTKP